MAKLKRSEAFTVEREREIQQASESIFLTLFMVYVVMMFFLWGLICFLL